MSRLLIPVIFFTLSSGVACAEAFVFYSAMDTQSSIRVLKLDDHGAISATSADMPCRAVYSGVGRDFVYLAGPDTSSDQRRTQFYVLKRNDLALEKKVDLEVDLVSPHFSTFELGISESENKIYASRLDWIEPHDPTTGLPANIIPIAINWRSGEYHEFTPPRGKICYLFFESDREIYCLQRQSEIYRLDTENRSAVPADGGIAIPVGVPLSRGAYMLRKGERVFLSPVHRKQSGQTLQISRTDTTEDSVAEEISVEGRLVGYARDGESFFMFNPSDQTLRAFSMDDMKEHWAAKLPSAYSGIIRVSS